VCRSAEAEHRISSGSRSDDLDIAHWNAARFRRSSPHQLTAPPNQPQTAPPDNAYSRATSEEWAILLCEQSRQCASEARTGCDALSRPESLVRCFGPGGSLSCVDRGLIDLPSRHQSGYVGGLPRGVRTALDAVLRTLAGESLVDLAPRLAWAPPMLRRRSIRSLHTDSQCVHEGDGPHRIPVCFVLWAHGAREATATGRGPSTLGQASSVHRRIKCRFGRISMPGQAQKSNAQEGLLTALTKRSRLALFPFGYRQGR
jgi:hypothetical protein